MLTGNYQESEDAVRKVIGVFFHLSGAECNEPGRCMNMCMCAHAQSYVNLRYGTYNKYELLLFFWLLNHR